MKKRGLMNRITALTVSVSVKVVVRYAAAFVAFCVFISAGLALGDQLRLFAETESSVITGQSDNAQNNVMSDVSDVSGRKAESIARVVELATVMAKQDVGSSYSEAEAVALAEAAAKKAAQEAAAQSAAAAQNAAAASGAGATAGKTSATATTSSGTSTTSGKKIVYITVDDGPSKLTSKYLDIFEKNGVKATFFVVGKQAAAYPDQIRRMKKDNHAIANHSYSHDYTAFYKSKSSFAAELKKWDDTISGILGYTYHTNVFRFPGGSTYSRAKQYRDYVKQLGYSYYDWTCLNGDAQISNRTADNLYNYLVSTYNNRNTEIVLIHDTNAKQTTVDMLDRMIKFFKNNGYEFRTLT